MNDRGSRSLKSTGARRGSSSLLVVALLSGTILLAGSSVPAPAAIPRPHVARLVIRVRTTSDWTKVQFSPGFVYASQVVAASKGVTVVKLTTGVLIEPPDVSSEHQVTFSAVYEDTGQAPVTTIHVLKGSWGSTQVDVRNNSAVPFKIATILNTSSGGESNDVSTPVDSRVFFGRVGPHYVPADTRRLVLAFYYGWWPHADYSDIPFLTAHPSDPRATDNAAGVLSMTRQARAKGIDGFIVSWAGDTNDGTGLDLALQASDATGGVTSVVLETVRATPTGTPDSPTDPIIVEQWLRQLMLRTGSRSFLRSGGIPVVFVYAMERMSPAAWQMVTADLAASGMPMRLVGDTMDPRYRNLLWGYYHYNPMGFSIKDLYFFEKGAAAQAHLLNQPSMLFASTASPGFDDHLLHSDDATVPRGSDGQRYAGTWKAAIGSDSDWVLVTSWNEWSEATSFEPSVEYGDVALQQTGGYASQFHHLTTSLARSG